MGCLLANFTQPEYIANGPLSLLWMFPLLAAIAIIYKATKVRVLFPGKFFKEALILFLSLSVFIILTGIGLIFLVQFLTSH